MAEIRLTPAATALLQRMRLAERMKRPILAIGWSRGQKDNHRGPQGESVWVRTTEPHWTVTFTDWAQFADVPVESRCVQLGEFNFLYGMGAREAPGVLVVDESNGSLVVLHEGAA
jgi:hypothetical protein